MRLHNLSVVLFVLLGLQCFLASGSQVTIVVTSIPSNTPSGASIYIAGCMNNWNPGHPEFEPTPNSQGHPSITLQGSGTLSFKFTRGSWPTVEGEYQDVFSRAGVFSPSFWFSDSVFGFASEVGKIHPMKYYLMGGTQENSNLVAQMQAMMDTLWAVGFSAGEIYLKVVPGGQHNEALWRSQFGEAYQWLFDVQSTDIVFPENTTPNRFRMFLQGSSLHLQGNCSGSESAGDMQVFNLNGQMIFAGTVHMGRPLQIPFPVPGIYVARLFTGNEVMRAKLLYF